MDRSDVKKLLDFGFSADRVFGFVNGDYNHDIFNKNLEVLRGIRDKMLDVRDTLRDDDIRKLLERLYKSWKQGISPESVDLTLIEARSLGYGLTNKTEEDFLNFLIQIEEADRNWTPSCLKGFLHSTLKNWNELKPGVREAIGWFIMNHAEIDAKDLSVIVPFIDSDGPQKLGAYLKKNKKSWQWAPPTVLMPTTRINYAYFSGTLIAYFQDVNKGEYDELRSALNLHNQIRTDKILLPRLILKSDSFDKDLLDIASKRIGDPFDESRWAPFENASDEQIKNLTAARKKLLSWIIQEVIRMFFEVLCKDKERKKFWSKHAHQIDDFTVYGSAQQKASLNMPPSILKHYKPINTTVNNCALTMNVGDYTIVEFTEVGALYAYKKGSRYYRNTVGRTVSINSINDLKYPSVTMLFDLNYYSFAEEGKMNHQGYWADRMEKWLQRYCL